MRDPLRRLAAICFVSAFCLAFRASAQIYSPLHIFSIVNGSTAPLTQGSDGTLYGVSALAGPPTKGTVFKVQPDGSGFSIIYSFTNGSDGSGPMAGLIISGNTMYGTAENGGSGGHGTVFKLNTDGSDFTTIYSFTAYTSGTNSDGATPLGSLVLSGNTLYGTASSGGVANGFGSIFKINTDGTGFTLFTCLVFRGSTIRLFRWQAWYYPAALYMARHTGVAEAELSVQCSRSTPMAEVLPCCILFPRRYPARTVMVLIRKPA
jgi:uncharacterized repeat protein (TIGR03803 family)